MNFLIFFCFIFLFISHSPLISMNKCFFLTNYNSTNKYVVTIAEFLNIEHVTLKTLNTSTLIILAARRSLYSLMYSWAGDKVGVNDCASNGSLYEDTLNGFVTR